MTRHLTVMAAAAMMLSYASAGPQTAGPALDHVTIAVADLTEAGHFFTSLGFTLKPGREHANSIENLHVKFSDGTELELLQPVRSEAMLDHFGVTEDTWRDAIAQDPHFLHSETPCFVGRATDPTGVPTSRESAPGFSSAAARIETALAGAGIHDRGQEGER